MILQPLIENAVKYSIHDSLEGATILLKASRGSDFLTIEISNPFDPRDVPPKGKGIGLNNVRQRLELIYGDKAEMLIEKSKQNFNCKLLLPL